MHRAGPCDLSLFQPGLRLLEFWLEEEVPLRVAFLPQSTQTHLVILKMQGRATLGFVSVNNIRIGLSWPPGQADMERCVSTTRMEHRHPKGCDT